jgi:hypothetical protein
MAEDKNVFSTGSWEDSQEEKDIFGKDEFKSLEEGDNLVRLLGQYIFRNVHYVPESRMKYILCGGDKCPLCASGNLPKLHYYINILDRKDDKIKILKFGITLKRKFQNIVQKYGDITTYDIILTRTGVNLDTKYEVLPMRESKPISDILRKYLLENFIDLETKFEIPSPEKILELVSSEPRKEEKAPGVNTSTKVNGTVKKDCFGQKYNPINPDCVPCELKENCKTMTIEFYTTGKK